MRHITTIALISVVSATHCAAQTATTRPDIPAQSAAQAEAEVQAARNNALESVSEPIRNTSHSAGINTAAAAPTTMPATSPASTQPAPLQAWDAQNRDEAARRDTELRDEAIRNGAIPAGGVYPYPRVIREGGQQGGTAIEQPAGGIPEKRPEGIGPNLGPANNRSGPGTNTQGPGNNTQGPGSNTQGPGNNTHGPGNNPAGPGQNESGPKPAK